MAVTVVVIFAIVIVTVAVLSAVFSNDIVCLAVAPVLAEACLRRGLDPVPFLLALACAANIASAATLIGNPQSMLIGTVLKLSFRSYLLEAIVPVVLGPAVLWALLALQGRRRWYVARAADAPAYTVSDTPLDRWQTGKGLNIIVVDAARKQGVTIDWRRHLRIGLPVTIATLAITAMWFVWRTPPPHRAHARRSKPSRRPAVWLSRQYPPRKSLLAALAREELTLGDIFMPCRRVAHQARGRHVDADDIRASLMLHFPESAAAASRTGPWSSTTRSTMPRGKRRVHLIRAAPPSAQARQRRRPGARETHLPPRRGAS